MNTVKQLNDKSIKTRLLYNKARVLTRLGNNIESIEHCEEAIRWCIEEEHIYGLGQLYYHIGYNYELEEMYEKALTYFEKSALIFETWRIININAYLVKKREEISSKIKSSK